MEPATKRRRLAPKVPDPPAQSQPQQSQPQHQQAPAPASAQSEQQPQSQHYASQDAHAPPPSERHDFEAFARHLQDAAIHIYRQAQTSPYTSVSVLLLRWEDDVSVEPELNTLEKVFRERYNYHTDKWQIPTVPNPSIKLGVQMASFLDQARPDHLLIIYYAGYGYFGADNQLYWACNSREDASKLKWDGVRCLFEDAQSDMLLLLDTCAVGDGPMAGSHGIKQAIAAYSPDQKAKEPGAQSFTTSLVGALQALATNGRSFSTQRLYDQILYERQEAAQPKLTNGASKTGAMQARTPVCFTLTPGKGQNLSLAPLAPKTPPKLQTPSESAEADGKSPKPAAREDQAADTGIPADLAFEEPRVLVCTTFVGDANPDMLFFNRWLHSTPPLASKLAVEGMFLGPPTVLLISMPHEIWNVVQHDKVCCFLGFIRSHNMLHLYQRLLGSTSVTKAIAKEVEDGRILLEAREAAANTTSSPGNKLKRDYPARASPRPPETPTRSSLPTGAPPPPSAADGTSQVAEAKDEVEDSAEMKEAAEQLKSLSDSRHRSDESTAAVAAAAAAATAAAAGHHNSSQVADSIDVRHDQSLSPVDANESGLDEKHYSTSSGGGGGGGGGGGNSSDFGSASGKSKARRLLQKQPTKQETRCSLCSHAPFKDTSTLRKHVAAAHTRPFPCAFSFAGCGSTFGSKNEWKRHIASQHLCLTYYRCSQCPQSAAEGKGNEFNRKDLFTQHLRRMHAPLVVKKAMANAGGGGGGKGGDDVAGLGGKASAEWETHVKEMQDSCRIVRRQPPQRSACPKPDCQSVFEGPGAWDEWTEHVGRHMEKGEPQPLAVDPLLAKWALEEGIIERKGGGEYRLCAGGGIGGGGGGGGESRGGGGGGGGESKGERRNSGAGERDGRESRDGGSSNNNHNSSFVSVSEAGQQKEDDDPSITVAISIPDSGSAMEVDD